MEIFITVVELIGAVAFAVSGSVTAIKKGFDVFGIIMLGIITAVGGGIMRDIFLGILPPTALKEPLYPLVAVLSSAFVMLPFSRRFLSTHKRGYELSLLISDSAGLGIFTACGVKTAFDCGFGKNTALVIFVAVITAVGGGVLRDVLSGEKPYIFVKHIYACASIVGAIAALLLWKISGENIAMIVCSIVVFTIRIISAHFHWKLPKPEIE